MSQLTNIPKDFLNWLREATRPAALLDGLKTAVWVVPLTVMIWIYAEQEQPHAPLQSQPIVIDLHSSDPDRIFTVVTRNGDVPTADLQGTKSQLDAVIAELSEPGYHPKVHIEVPKDLSPGVHDLNIASQIESAPIFSANGILVSNVRPQSIQINIDTMESRKDVALTATGNPNLVGTPIFEPATVTISAPASALADAKGPLALVPIPTTTDYSNPGPHAEVPLAVTSSISGNNVSITPSKIKVTYEIKRSDVEYQIPSIPVRRSLASTVPNDVVVEYDPNLTNVNVIGPPDAIDRIKNKKTSPSAELWIGKEDIGAAHIQKTLHYVDLDPGVQIVEPNRTIEVSVHQ